MDRKLEQFEIDAIREEQKKLGSLDKAIIFCLGYKGRQMTNAMRDTFDAVKKQILN